MNLSYVDEKFRDKLGQNVLQEMTTVTIAFE